MFRDIDREDESALAAQLRVMRYIGCHAPCCNSSGKFYKISNSTILQAEKVDDGEITITIQILGAGQILPALLSFRCPRQIAEKQEKLS